MKKHDLIVAGQRRRRGFSLIELMVGLAVGLVVVLVVVQVLSVAEGQKRSTTSGADAQVSGSLALYTIQRDIQMAGYGFASNSGALGCTLSYSYNAGAIVNFPATLVPVTITAGAGGAPDSIRVLSSGKTTAASVPTRIIPPGYNPAVAATSLSFPVMSSIGIKKGDLLVAVTDTTVPCSVFQATADGAGGSVPRADDPTHWNATGLPATSYGDGSYIVNLGPLIDHNYNVDPVTNTLKQQVFSVSVGAYAPATDIQPGIVQLKAMYGMCSTCNATTAGAVDSYTTTTPTSNALWSKVMAIRVAVVARSTLFEKDTVSGAGKAVDQDANGVLWDVGAAAAITGAATTQCHGTSQCVSIPLNSAADWKNYRYKIYDMVIPLRNMVWKS